MASKKDVNLDKYLHYEFDSEGYEVDLDSLHTLTNGKKIEPSVSESGLLSRLSLKDRLKASRADTRVSDVVTKQNRQEIDLTCSYEISFALEREEYDLKNGFQTCEKKEDHKKYIPIEDFKIHHLPGTFQDVDLVKMIQAISNITVKLNTKFVSKERPEYWPQSDQQRSKEEKLRPFPLYYKKLTTSNRNGTGRISSVEKCTEENPQKTCMCKKCRVSDKPSKVWWMVSLYTALHVVFDDHEADKTTCTLFYDSPHSKVVTLDDWKIERADPEFDMCIMVTFSCDERLMTRLEKMLVDWRAQWKKMLKKYKGTILEDKLVVIVSHPHGCTKQVSCGFLKEKREEIQVMNVMISRYTYETTTCPGSSGAHVHLVGRFEDGLIADHVHTGINTMGNNFCSPGMEYLSDD